MSLGGTGNVILTFDVTLSIKEEDYNHHPIPQQTIDNLFKTLGLFTKK
jgi:hypothetical protein